MNIKIGDRNFNNGQNLEMEVIEIIDKEKIKVRFVNSGFERVVYANNFLKGKVMDKYSPKLSCGYLGNTTCMNPDKKTHKCSYKHWLKMLRRTNKDQHKDRAYQDCSVCEEWMCFENFEKWFDENYYECPIGGLMCLDKDILVKGNKVYSPNTCCFVPNAINTAFALKNNKDRNLPRGVKKKNNSFIASTTEYGKSVYIGSFKNADEAFLAYKKERELYIKDLANTYKEYIPKNVYDSMCSYEVSSYEN